MHNSDGEDAYCFSFAWFQRSSAFGDPYFSFQKQISFTIIYTLSKKLWTKILTREVKEISRLLLPTPFGPLQTTQEFVIQLGEMRQYTKKNNNREPQFRFSDNTINEVNIESNSVSTLQHEEAYVCAHRAHIFSETDFIYNYLQIVQKIVNKNSTREVKEISRFPLPTLFRPLPTTQEFVIQFGEMRP